MSGKLYLRINRLCSDRKSKRGTTLTAALLLMSSYLGPYTATRAMSQVFLGRPLVVKWRYETQELLNFRPAIYKTSLYLPLADGNLVSVNSADGVMAWKAELGGEITASPFADESGVYLATRPEDARPAGSSRTSVYGVLRALGSESGVTLWSIKLPGVISGDIAGNGTALFARSTDGRLYSVQKETGRVLWTRRNEQPLTSGPILNAGRVYAGNSEGSVFALDQESGRNIWRYRTPGAINAPFSVTDQILYLVSGGNYVYALAAKEGRLLWRRRVPARIQSVVSTPKGVLVTSLDNTVSLLSAETGKRVWKQRMNGRVTAPPVTDGEAALFAPLSGEECIVLDVKTGRRLNAVYVGEDNNTSAPPLIAGETLFLTTRAGLLAFTGSD